MKLLFPVFASLVIQYQVNTEFVGLRRCLKGFGKCKDHCTAEEKEVQKCKKKKCCIGPKVIQMIKNHMQSELTHTFEEESQELLKSSMNSAQTIYRILSLPQSKSVNPFANTKTTIIPKGSTLNSATNKPMISRESIYTNTSTKSETIKRDLVTDSPPPAPPTETLLIMAETRGSR